MLFKSSLLTVLLVIVSIVAGVFWMQGSRPLMLNAQSVPPDNDQKGLQNYRIISFDLPEDLWFAGEKVPLNMFYIRESLERELIVNTYWHSSTLLLLKRANRWFPVIEPILIEQGIPADFKYLSMIESNLTNARSPAGAAGFWQFLETTGKEYGLEVNQDVDERYHLEKATVAATKYFKKAHEKYGSWALVAAAYNAGTRRIDGFLADQKASSYYDLLMAEETERYVFRMIAMKMILNDPAMYGFYPDLEKLYAPLKFTIVPVNATIHDLADFARGYGISYKLLKVFNPWLRSNKLPVAAGKSYEIKIPLEPYNQTHLPFDEFPNKNIGVNPVGEEE